MPNHIPVQALKHFTKMYGLRQSIMVAWDGERTHVVTYGVTLDECGQAAEGGNRVKRALNWPEELCRDEPPRVADLKKKVFELEALVESISQGAATAQGKLVDIIAGLRADKQALEDNAMQYRRMICDLEGRIGNALL